MEDANVPTDVSRNEKGLNHVIVSFGSERKARHDEEHRKAYYREMNEELARFRADEMNKIVHSMLLNNEPIEKIVKYTGFTPEKISAVSKFFEPSPYEANRHTVRQTNIVPNTA